MHSHANENAEANRARQRSGKRGPVVRPPRHATKHWKDEVVGPFALVTDCLMVSHVAAAFAHYLGEKSIKKKLCSPGGNNCIAVRYKPSAQTLLVSGTFPGYAQDHRDVTCMDVVAQTFAMYRAANRECELNMSIDVGRKLSAGAEVRLSGLTVNLLLRRTGVDSDGDQVANIACAAVQQGLVTEFVPRRSVRLSKGPRFEKITISDNVRTRGWKFPDVVGMETVRALTQRTLVVRIEFDGTHLRSLAEEEQEEPTPAFFTHDLLTQRVMWLLSFFAPWKTPLGELLAWHNFVRDPCVSVDQRILHRLNMDKVRANLMVMQDDIG